MKDVKFYKNVKNNNDEYYTPLYAVTILDKYIKPNSTIWCPFDTDDSEFVKHFKEIGHKVINTHIFNGEDFFSIDVPECDYIISNPPFSKKLEVFKRLYEIGKPFAMVCGLPILNYQEIGHFFLNKELQLLIVDKKVSFDGNTASFNSSYFCYKMLPKDIIFTHLDNNNSKKYFVKSRMEEIIKNDRN